MDSSGTLPPSAPNPPARFCKLCGNPLEPPGSSCSVCADEASAPVAPAASLEPGSVGPALVLYFLILGSNVYILFEESMRAQIVAELIDAGIVFLFCAISWSSIRPLLGPVKSGYLLASVPLALATFSLAWLSVQGTRLLFTHLEEELYVEPYLAEGYGMWVVVLSVCVQPAIVEELAFRGVILSALLTVLTRQEAILVSALLFMILHLSVLSLPHLLILGLLLGWLRVKTGSIWPCVAVHFLHNALALAFEM